MEIEIGKSYEVRYPFCRCMVEVFSIDGIGEVPSWKPGVYFEQSGPYGESSDSMCDDEGKAIFTVVSTHKPGKYPERVFFTRQWVDPSGQVFGKNNLRMTTKTAFKQLIKGYRHEYEVYDRETHDN